MNRRSMPEPPTLTPAALERWGRGKQGGCDG